MKSCLGCCYALFVFVIYHICLMFTFHLRHCLMRHMISVMMMTMTSERLDIVCLMWKCGCGSHILLLLYRLETWVTHRSHICLLKHFNQCCLHHPQHSLESLHHKCLEQAKISSIEVPAAMGRTCLQNDGPSFTKDCPVW